MTRWREIIIEGPKTAAQAFVAGFLAARGQSADEAVWEHEIGLAADSLIGRIALALSAERHHGLFAPHSIADEIAQGIEQHGLAAELRIESRLDVKNVTFELEAEVFSEELAFELRAMLADLPAGTTIEQLTSGQEVHPDASGVELYSPQHDYTYRVSGRVRGNGGALRLLRLLCQRDFARIHDIVIDAAPA